MHVLETALNAMDSNPASYPWKLLGFANNFQDCIHLPAAPKVFYDLTTTTTWLTSTSAYAYATGLYNTAAYTTYQTTVDGVSQSGEYLQLETGTSHVVLRYGIRPFYYYVENNFPACPVDFILACSSDGSTWTALDVRTGVS
jgi:hypothetical protein